MNCFRNFLTAGVDEAGRGPLAGPVVVAAVILDKDNPIEGLDDSKKLSEKKREELYEVIVERALGYAIVEVDPKQIDEMNILQATLFGMSKAVKQLDPKPEFVLIDGNQVPHDLRDIARAVVGGDAYHDCISAASILAKVTRDRIMVKLSAKYPEYNFQKHKGYPTKEHIEALEKHGACEIHRKSFEPVRKVLK